MTRTAKYFQPAATVTYAWSAAFIWYVMRLAGAGGSFPYSENHADYINAAAAMMPGVALKPSGSRSTRRSAAI